MTPGQERAEQGREVPSRATVLLRPGARKGSREAETAGGCGTEGGAVRDESWQRPHHRAREPLLTGHTATARSATGLGKQELGAEKSPELTFSPVVPGFTSPAFFLVQFTYSTQPISPFSCLRLHPYVVTYSFLSKTGLLDVHRQLTIA